MVTLASALWVRTFCCQGTTASSQRGKPTALCDAISVVAEFMVKSKLASQRGKPTALCAVTREVTEFMVRRRLAPQRGMLQRCVPSPV
jgi:hypothetical protein